MKKIILIITVALASVSCQQDKIAFVDNTKLLNEYQEKIDIEAKYKTIFEAFGKKRDSITQAFQVEAQAFQEEAQKLSQNAAQEKYQSLMQKSQTVQQQIQGEEQQLAMESQGEIDSLLKKVKEFVVDYGKTNGYTFILGKNDAGSVMYGESSKDITDQVLKALNDKYKK
ncbi:hypothetical protein I215_01180 [Galbibacter marinus]|uniref:Outer membrane chaperone Skp n=1 Tax=Galbibacter marinus TaxID=555500 RepID=K2PZF8_9FLAO|nr:OmpH family outer membrane protein [Galbibacter marinus]EKF56784.1 hypothetical protein I215_01180 [Galbibacter marinus]